MAKKHWEMTVTSFSSETVLASAKVEGVNWMVALGAARRVIGEDGGVPAGASCTVTADGGVRVQDPVSQRTYQLRPMGAGEEKTLPEASQVSPEPSQMSYGSTPVAGRSAQDIARDGVTTVTSPAAATRTPSSSYRPPAPTSNRPPTSAVSDPRVPESPLGEPPFKLQPLRARDREPTEQNPVTFRERTYVVPTGTPAPSIELLLRQEFEKIKGSLGSSRSATYVAMAVFDHVWSKKPERPPVVALDWKDWRGADPQITFPLSAPSSKPSPALRSEPTKKGTGQTRLERPQPAQAAPAQPAPVAAQASPLVQPTPVNELPTEIVTPKKKDSAPAQSAAAQPDVAAQSAAAAQAISAANAQSANAPSAESQADPDDDLSQLDQDFPLEPEWSTSDGGSSDLRLDIAFERSQQLFSLRSPKDGIEFVIDLCEQLLPSAAFTGAIYDIDTDELRFVTVRGDGSDGLQGRAIDAKAGLFGAAAQLAGGSINLVDVTSNGAFDASADGRNGVQPQSALYLPIAAEGRLLAVIQCMNRRGSENYSDDDVEVATYLASQLSEFLGVARRSLLPSRV